MSHFLQNLIARHHEENASAEASRFVQPRPRSRFEGPPEAVFSSVPDSSSYGFDDQTAMRSVMDRELHSEQSDLADRPASAVENEQPPQQAHVSMQIEPEKSSARFIQSDQADSNRQDNDFFERSETVKRQPEPESTNHQIAKKTAVRYEENQQVENSARFDSRNLSLSDDEVKNRLQSTLDRLNSTQQQHSAGQGIGELHSDVISGLDSSDIARENNEHSQADQNHTNKQRRTDQEVQRKNTSQFETPSVAYHNPSTGEVSDRIQTLLNRLNSQQSQPINTQSPIDLKPEFLVSPDLRKQRQASETNHLNNPKSQQEDSPRIINHSLHESATEIDLVKPMRTITSSLGTEQNVDVWPTETKLTKPVTDRLPERQAQKKNGVMQVPDWLTEIQASLNENRQQIEAHEQPEPVVNVTIGRIEIKAIQAETGKKSQVRTRPSGVMSLDEYLKLRKNRGRA